MKHDGALVLLTDNDQMNVKDVLLHCREQEAKSRRAMETNIAYLDALMSAGETTMEDKIKLIEDQAVHKGRILGYRDVAELVNERANPHWQDDERDHDPRLWPERGRDGQVACGGR